VAAGKVKVIDLAKELGVTSKDLMVAAEEMGHKGVRAMTPLDSGLANALRVKLRRNSREPKASGPPVRRCQDCEGAQRRSDDGSGQGARARARARSPLDYRAEAGRHDRRRSAGPEPSEAPTAGGDQTEALSSSRDHGGDHIVEPVAAPPAHRSTCPARSRRGPSLGSCRSGRPSVRRRRPCRPGARDSPSVRSRRRASPSVRRGPRHPLLPLARRGPKPWLLPSSRFHRPSR
jgi:translation initiation factor IF-2